MHNTESAPPRQERAPDPGGLKLKAAANYIGGVSKPSMYRLIARGLLRPNRSLRHLIFSREELDRFLKDGMSE